MAEQKFNFTTKLHKCCSNDKEELRPWSKAIHFIGGYAYATDSNVLVKTSLEYQNVIAPENLDGKSIHKDNFREILKFEIVECCEDGVSCKNNDGQVAFYEYIEFKDVKIPDFDKVIPDKSKVIEINQIGIDPKNVERCTSAMYSDSGAYRLRFTGAGSAILVDVVGYSEQIGIIMPRLLSDSIFD